MELLIICTNQEAGEASDVLVSCTVQIYAAHAPQTFLGIALETTLLQSDDLGSGPRPTLYLLSLRGCDPAEGSTKAD